jgi:hypothetical protein
MEGRVYLKEKQSRAAQTEQIRGDTIRLRAYPVAILSAFRAALPALAPALLCFALIYALTRATFPPPIPIPVQVQLPLNTHTTTSLSSPPHKWFVTPYVLSSFSHHFGISVGSAPAPFPKRSHTCGALTSADVGSSVVLAGWLLPER